MCQQKSCGLPTSTGSADLTTKSTSITEQLMARSLLRSRCLPAPRSLFWHQAWETTRWQLFAYDRGPSIRYELAEKPWAESSRWYGQRFSLGRTITVHIRPAGPARIIVDRGRGNEIAWFDTSNKLGHAFLVLWLLWMLTPIASNGRTTYVKGRITAAPLYACLLTAIGSSEPEILVAFADRDLESSLGDLMMYMDWAPKLCHAATRRS